MFHGAAAGEDPRLATMWVILGQPITGVAVPLWVAAGAVPAQLAVGKDPAPLNVAFDRVRELLFPSGAATSSATSTPACCASER